MKNGSLMKVESIAESNLFCLIEFHILINCTSPFPLFNKFFFSICIQILIEYSVSITHRLMWVCTFCLYPTKMMLDVSAYMG